jgi:hypothetical protein
MGSGEIEQQGIGRFGGLKVELRAAAGRDCVPTEQSSSIDDQRPASHLKPGVTPGSTV